MNLETNLPLFTNKKAAYIFEIIMMFLIVVFIFWSGIYTYHENPVSYWIIFCHILIVCLCWNIFDLIVMDWLTFSIEALRTRCSSSKYSKLILE